MYWWSDSLSHPRECHWSEVCMLMHGGNIQDIHIQTHRSNLLQQMVEQMYYQKYHMDNLYMMVNFPMVH